MEDIKRKIKKIESEHLLKLVKEYEKHDIKKLYRIYDKIDFEINNNKLEHDKSSKIIERYKKHKVCYDLDTIEGKLLILKAIKTIVNNKDIKVENKYKGYPSYNNINFSNEIRNKFEFRPILTHNNHCDSGIFEKQPHQLFLKNFISNNTPYRSILIYHGTGSGKTCTGVSIAENFRDVYSDVNKRIIILASKNIIENWKKTIFNPLKGNEQCTEDIFIKIVKENMKGINHLKITNKKVAQIIKKYYEFYGYQKFANDVKKIIHEYSKNANDDDNIRLQHKAIRNYFSNRVIIIDEVHNIRNNSEYNEKDIITILTLIANIATNLRLILLTATPMYNTSSEIIWLTNLMLLNDNRDLIKESDIFKEGGITKKGRQILSSKLRGYVSYIRGENPYTFPIRLYPKDNGDKNSMNVYPDIDLFGDKISNPIKFLNLFGCKMENYQKYIYNKRKNQLIKGRTTLKIDDETELMQISNIIYPGGSETVIKDVYGERGFLNTFELVGDKKNGNYRYKKNMIQFLENGKLNKFSTKISQLIERIKSSSGIVYIYSQYIYSGILPLVMALEQHGYKKYSGESIFNHEEWSEGKKNCKYEPISYTGETYSKYNRGNKSKPFKQGKYIVITGDSMLSKDNTKEIDALISDDNKHGENVKIIIGNVFSSEGIDLKRVREIHILDPWHHLNRLEQVIGRGIRFCSHNDLDDSNNYTLKNVTIYLYNAYINEKESIDSYIYRHAEFKSINIGKVELLLKQNAIDCSLFYSNNILDENIRRINIVSSQGKHILNYKPIYIEYSKICSFSKECKYKCITNTNKYEINYDTVSNESITYLANGLYKYIQELFLFKHNYSIDEIIDYIVQYINVDNKLIFFAINSMITKKHIILDRNRTQGYIINRANQYIFQPLNIINEDISLYDRTNNLKSTNKYIQLDINYSNNSIHRLSKIKPVEVYDKIDNEYNSMKRDKLLQNKLYEKILTNKSILIQYILDRLLISERFSIIHDIYIKKYKRGQDLNELETIIFNYIRCNYIYNIRKYYVFDNNNITDEPIGMYCIYKNNPIYMIFDEDKYEESNEIKALKISEYIKTYKSKNSYQNKYNKLPNIWGYGYKQYRSGEEQLYLKVSTTNGENPYEGVLCQDSSQSSDKRQIIEYMGKYFTKYFSKDLYKPGIINSKKNICKLFELILRIESTNKNYYLSYDSIYLKYA